MLAETHRDGKGLSPSLPEWDGSFRLLGVDPPGLGMEKGGDAEAWAGVIRKAEVVVWKK